MEYRGNSKGWIKGGTDDNQRTLLNIATVRTGLFNDIIELVLLQMSSITTFHSDVDTLVLEQLGLNEHMAAVLSFVQFFLHVQQLQRAVVLERPLTVIKREKVGVLVPFDGVIRVTNHMAVNVHVPPSYCCEVFHWSYVSRTFKGTKTKHFSLKEY